MSGAASVVGLSLIVPLCDERPNLERLVEACAGALAALPVKAELILVDDGSRDGSTEWLDERVAAWREGADGGPELLVVHHRRRFGKGAALTSGVAAARGETIATLDADLQEDPAELPRLLAALAGGDDLVSGCRADRQDGWRKRVSSKVYNALTRALGGPPLRDINCGFKAMRRDLAAELLLEAGRFRLMPLIAHHRGYRVSEVDITHRPRVAGRSHFGTNRFPGALFDLFAIVFLLRYEERPGHPFLIAGSLSALIGTGVCTHLAVRWVLDGYTIQHRYPYLAFGILCLLLGGQLLATGILGEWLAWRTGRAKPRRVESELRSGQEASADSGEPR